MGLRDRLTDGVGSLISGGVDLISESLEKASRTDDDPTKRDGQASALIPKAERALLPPSPESEDPTSLLYDPFALIDQLGYRDKPSGITYQTLRQMSRKVPTFTAILQTRLSQVSSFGQRQLDQRDPGFGIVLRDSKKSPSNVAKKRMWELEEWLLHTGTPAAHDARFAKAPWARVATGRDSFRVFLRKFTRDSLELDQACMEIQHNRKGFPWAFYCVDGATIRLADSPPGSDNVHDPMQVRYVQIYDEVIISEFAAHQMCFGVRNPRSDIVSNGYGVSELEMLVNVITATLFSIEYNSRQFSQGSLVHGVMNFKGSVPDRKIDAFRRQWKMMLSGVSNSHKTPMTNVDELQWIDFQKSNRDMEFAAWLDFLIKITSAVCLFDPSEINFNYGNSGQGNQMFSTPVDNKLKNSKDRGLRPILKDIEDWINQYLIWQLDPELEFRFLGLDAKSSDQAVDHSKKRAEFLMTIDELRAEEDLEPLPDGQGEVILNQIWLQNKQGSQGGEGAGEGEDGGFGDFGGGEDGQDPGDGNPPLQPPDEEDYDAMFPPSEEGEKALLSGDELRKGMKRAKVRVYDIEL